jgi:hypothetical protein
LKELTMSVKASVNKYRLDSLQEKLNSLVLEKSELEFKIEETKNEITTRSRESDFYYARDTALLAYAKAGTRGQESYGENPVATQVMNRPRADNELPEPPKVDNTLPSKPSKPDNTLPSRDKIDNTLPSKDRIDNTLPSSGNKPTPKK